MDFKYNYAQSECWVCERKSGNAKFLNLTEYLISLFFVIILCLANYRNNLQVCLKYITRATVN